MEKYDDAQQLMRQQQAVGGISAGNTVSGLRYTLATDRSEYRRGDQVRITFTICNTTARVITLNYTSSQRFDIVALLSGSVVWRWSEGQFFSQMAAVDRLRPGECRTYRANWDLRDRRGNFVVQGNYTIQAENVAVQLRNRFVQTRIAVSTGSPPRPPNPPISPPSPPRPPAPSPNRCSRANMLSNPSFEGWAGVNSPRSWSGDNVLRSNLPQSGQFAAEMGVDAGRQATLSQTVLVGPGFNYQITFWARERIRNASLSRYVLEGTIYLYDRSGRFISRVDPSFSAASIPDSTYRQFRFTTGVLPGSADRAELRFIFRPFAGNTNSVIIDNAEMVCVSR